MIKTGLLDDRPVELLAGKIVEMSPEAGIPEYWLVNLQTGELII